MATYTRVQLRNRVLGRLGVLDPTQSPSAEDAVLVEEAIQQTFEELYDDGLIPFAWEADAIPGAYMIPLSFIVALPLIADFDTVANEAAIVAGADRGMKRLRKLKVQPYFGPPQQATYY